MSKFSHLRVKIGTALDLGLKEVFLVLVYRLLLKLNIHSVCKIKSNVPYELFFKDSCLDKLNVDPISSWQSEGYLFSHFSISVNQHPPDWLSNPITGVKSEKGLLPWWKISDFEEKTGDIKLMWELSRFDWVLAFAQRARNGEEKALDRLNSWISNWLSVNPPYLGPNWKCGQEASIRVINLCCASLILGQEKNAADGLQTLISMHLKRISPTIQYAIAQNNNHGTSEAAALFLGGSLLSAHGNKDGDKWRDLGSYWLENRVLRLIESDGSFSQYSLNYHRMLLDTLSIVEVWRNQFNASRFSPQFYKQASLAAMWLYQMVDPIGGDGPNLGANDGTRILQLTDSVYRDYRPSVHLAMALFNKKLAYSGRGFWNMHLAWLNVPESSGDTPEYHDCNYDKGGYKLLRFREAKALVRFPKFRFRPSHADALHVDLWVKGINLLSDAGSYSYNSAPDISRYFTGCIAHNTIQFDDRDQMPKLGRFLFGAWLKATLMTSISQNLTSSSCTLAYKDYKKAKHIREVVLSEDNLSVLDRVRGFEKKAVLRWRLSKGEWNIQFLEEKILASNGSESLIVTSSMPITRACLTEGWVSMFYMERKVVPVLEVEINSAGTFTTKYFWDV